MVCHTVFYHKEDFVSKVRMGVIGGGMGNFHLSYMKEVTGLELTAFCDVKPEVMQNTSAKYGVKGFLNYREMVNARVVNAVLIATPHYFHPDIALYAFQKGVHVLTEKPVAVQVKDAVRMNQAAQKTRLVYGVMFQERTLPHYAKIKELVNWASWGP